MNSKVKFHKRGVSLIYLFFVCMSHLVCASEKTEQAFSIQGKRPYSYSESESESGSQEESKCSKSIADSSEEQSNYNANLLDLFNRTCEQVLKPMGRGSRETETYPEGLMSQFENGKNENNFSDNKFSESSTFSSESRAILKSMQNRSSKRTPEDVPLLSIKKHSEVSDESKLKKTGVLPQNLKDQSFQENSGHQAEAFSTNSIHKALSAWVEQQEHQKLKKKSKKQRNAVK